MTTVSKGPWAAAESTEPSRISTCSSPRNRSRSLLTHRSDISDATTRVAFLASISVKVP